MRTPFLLLAAAVLVLAPGAPASARPYDVSWQDVTALAGEGQLLAVDQGTGDVLAMTTPGYDSQVLRRLDRRTGDVEWTTELGGQASHLVVDPTDGRIVLAGYHLPPGSVTDEGAGRLRITILDRDGRVLQDLPTDIGVASLADLDVDPVSGLACTLTSNIRSEIGRRWVTSCWDRSGALRFTREWEPPAGRSQPNVLAIDPVAQRVYVAGVSQSNEDHARDAGQDVVLLAYEADGTLRWAHHEFGAAFRSYLEIAVDSARGRIHVLDDPATSAKPAKLFSFDALGRTRFVSSWRDAGNALERAVAVGPKGNVLAVETGGSRAALRVYRPSGRLLTARTVRIAPPGDDGGLVEVVIDSVRGRVHVLTDSSEHSGAAVRSFLFSGRRIASVLVDARKDAHASSIALHDASGTVFAATSPWPHGVDRLVALRP